MKFDYVRYDGTPAACDIDVHRREGFTLVVVSEEDGHRFGGIRESADELATLFCRKFNLGPQWLVWIEHDEYNEVCPDAWYLVTFGFNWSKGALADPKRTLTTERHVADLLERDGAVALALWKERMMAQTVAVGG